jgi:hypothetical protein
MRGSFTFPGSLFMSTISHSIVLTSVSDMVKLINENGIKWTRSRHGTDDKLMQFIWKTRSDETICESMYDQSKILTP